MAMGIWLPGGGGADLDAVTASAGDVLAGKVIVGPDGEPLTGTLALSGNASDGQVLSGQTYYNTDAKTKRIGTMPNRGTVNQSLAINGSYTIPAGYHNGNGKVTQSVKTKGAQTFTPGRSNQVIGANQWLSGAQTIMGDPNLKPENIKKGVPIFGNVGTHEGFVPSTYDIYNRGSWGSGYGTASVQPSNNFGSIEFRSSNIYSFGGVHNGRFRAFSVTISRQGGLINLQPYRTINIVYSTPVLGLSGQVWEVKLMLDTNDEIYATGKESKTEKTITLDISNVGVTDKLEFFGYSERWDYVNIYRIYFT